MKAIFNFIKEFLIGIWVIVAIFATICLIASNEHGVSEFGSYSLFVIDTKSLSDYGFDKNDIVIVKKELEDKYKIGDNVFFVYGNKDYGTYINFGEITNVKRVEGGLDGFVFNKTEVSYDNLIGSGNGALLVKKWGLALGLLESKWGFMFLIILPTLYAVVYEVYAISLEVKKKVNEELKVVENENKE